MLSRRVACMHLQTTPGSGRCSLILYLPLADTVYGAAADCLQRALNLTNGCQSFLKVLNNNGGDLSLMTVFQVLEVRGLLALHWQEN